MIVGLALAVSLSQSPPPAELSSPPPAEQVTAEPDHVPEPTDAPAPLPPGAPEEDDMAGFYKGELGSPNQPTLENPNDAVFLGLGYYNIGGLLGDHYLRLTPSLDLYFDTSAHSEMVLRLEVPLNFLLARPGSQPGSFGERFRKSDYDEIGDFLKVIKSFRLGRKEDNLFVNVGRLYGVSIGHGAVVRRYNANIDPDRNRTGVQVDAYNQYGGVETFISDLAFQTRVMGLLGFIKPFSFFSDNAVGKTFSVGMHYTADFDAPARLRRTPRDRPSNLPNPVVVNDAGYPQYDSTVVQFLGVDAEVKPIRLGNAFDLKLYMDYSHLLGAGGGFTAGALLRSNLGMRPFLNAFRVRFEGRTWANNYDPQYFDSLYEVQKLQMLSGEPTGREPTKYEAVVQAPSGPQHSGMYLEAAYALVDNLTVGFGLESWFDQPLYNFLVFLEVPAFEFLRFYASYQKVGFTSLGRVFATADRGAFAFEPDTVFYSQVRAMILPVLFINLGLQQTYQWRPELKGGTYAAKTDFLVEIELGWEFDTDHGEGDEDNEL